MKIKLNVSISAATIEEAVLAAIEEASQVSGVGADAATDYECVGIEAITSPEDVEFQVLVELSRLTGKFAAADEVAEVILDSLDTEVAVEFEAAQ